MTQADYPIGRVPPFHLRGCPSVPSLGKSLVGPNDGCLEVRTRNGDRGAVAVEAALVTPLILLLITGVIELALLMRDDVALTSAVRNGGRTASANANAGPGGVSEGGDCVSPCS